MKVTRRLLLAGAGIVLAARPARAAEDEAERAARWQELRRAVFGDRTIQDGAGVLALEAPARAQDAATVPIAVALSAAGIADQVAAIWIIVDANPSPLAGVFRYGPAGDARHLALRVRVDRYTLIHAVAETRDGRLFATDRFVKAAGGCSAPSSKDPRAALARIGQMRLRMEGGVEAIGNPAGAARLMISHPNNNGMQVDQLTHNFVPARYIQDIGLRRGDALVMQVEADISLSEDPVITFGLRPENAGALLVEVRDSTGAAFRQSFPMPEKLPAVSGTGG